MEGSYNQGEIYALEKYSKSAAVMWDMEIQQQPTREEHHVQTNAPGKMLGTVLSKGFLDIVSWDRLY